MSPEFEAELKAALIEAGLPPRPKEIIGRLYQFCSAGEIISGTIHSIGIVDGSLDLYVTNPRFQGLRLINIQNNNGKWMAHIDAKPRKWSDEELDKIPDPERAIDDDLLAGRYFEGEFELISDD